MCLTWKVINEILNKSKRQDNYISLLINNQLTSDPTIIVNKFNEFFVNVGPNLSSKIGPSNADIKDFLQPSVSNSIVMHPTDKFEVMKII